MPEGDSVVRTARLLDRALEGQALLASDFRVPRLATVDLGGSVAGRTRTYGKHLLTEVESPSGPLILHSHLGMDGSWQEVRAGERWRAPAHQARVVLRTPRGQVVGFALRTLDLVARDAEESLVGHLGPDLAVEDWDRTEALRRFGEAAGTGVGAALLDQRLVAGLGTVLVSESCFLRGVSPLRAVGEVDDLPRLLETASLVLRTSAARGYRTTTGDRHRGRDLWVYGREGRPCRRCGTHVRRSEVGPELRRRSLWWCPSCQR